MPRLDTLILTSIQAVQAKGLGSHLRSHGTLVVEGLALHRETTQKLEVVVAFDVLCPGESILVEPGNLVIPVDGAIDTLSGR